MGIEYKGNPGSKGKKSSKRYICATEYITGNYIQSYVLKQKLIRDGIKEAKCELCGSTEWMGKPIPLELHHRDGDHYNNNLDNLEILCPNCHALQPNYRGRNTKEHKRKHSNKNKNKHNSKEKNYCKMCGKEIDIRSNYCVSCYAIVQQKQQRPERDVLKKLIRTTSFLQIGKQFNVSDKTISKWCKSMNLPYRRKDINMLSDDEWDNI